MATGRIDIIGVTKRFDMAGGRLTALCDIDLSIAPGEFVTLVGTSGCGKSTLLRLITGLEGSTSGTVLHDGVSVDGPSLARGLVFQEPRLFPWLSVADNIAAALANTSLSRSEKRALVAEHVALVGLRGFEHAWPHQLSGGMAQRAAIARGLINQPGVLLLDEPFGALDALTRARMQDELLGIWARQRTTMVLVTHDVEEAVYLGDRVVVMSPRPGRIKQVFSVALNRPRDRAAPDFARLRRDVLSVLEGDDGIAPPVTAARPEAALATRRLFGVIQGAKA
ncbi:MAG TPA: ABC transporter ATP-binding protein [Acidisphaera sp.]|nr:ABC transporter ATP-binding protein [Acidisphaera sp.]